MPIATFLLLLVFCLTPFPTLWAKDVPTTPSKQPLTLEEALNKQDTKRVAELLQAQITTETRGSAETFYNLGVALASQDQPGKAFLAFDRALLLHPKFHEARQNIRTLERLGSRRFHHEKTLMDQLAATLLPGTWKVITTWSAWAIALGLAATVTRLTKKRWPWIVLASLAASTALAGAIMTAHRDKLPNPTTIQVITTKDSQALNAPADTAQPVIPLPAGSHVVELERVPGWIYVEIPAEKINRGWVPQTALEPLWPWSAELVQ